MANIVKGDGENAEKKSSPNIIYEEFKPFSIWAEDSDCNRLLIDLPGFNKEEVSLQADHKSNYVTISGQRKVKENKYKRFEQSYKVPENSNVEEISSKFEDEILYLIVPKKTGEGHDTTSNSSSSDEDDDSQSLESSWDEDLQENGKGNSCKSTNKGVFEEEEFHDKKMEKQSNESKLLEEVKKKLRKNKKIIITAVLAFSLGVLFSQKLQSIGQREIVK